jgi:Golgi phosphoprotein 3 (GPP34)
MIHPTQLKVSADGEERLELPQALYGQLFLLAYDRRRGRLDGDVRWRFGLALRTAMLTDLYLTGHLTDEAGRPCPTGIALPADPLLREALDGIGDNKPKDWKHAVAQDQRNVSGIVRSQLAAAGWLCVQPRRAFGIIPSTRIRLHDEDLVGCLADRVVTALRDAIAGRPTDKRPAAVGLIGALAELPTVFGFDEARRHYSELEDLVDRGVPPITGMRKVIDAVHTAMSANDTGPYST